MKISFNIFSLIYCFCIPYSTMECPIISKAYKCPEILEEHVSLCSKLYSLLLLP